MASVNPSDVPTLPSSSHLLIFLSYFLSPGCNRKRIISTTMIASVNVAPPPVPIYNLPDLKRHIDDQTAFELYQIVEAAQAHIPVPKQDTVSLL
jgi:hypothetical protein